MIEYVYRKKRTKKSKCYHIKTATGTVCKMENSTCFRKLDTISEKPPADKRLCKVCDSVFNNKPYEPDQVEREAWEREATWD